MDNRSRRRLFHRAIMSMNAMRDMDARERRFDMAYGILLVALLLVPLALDCVAFAFERYLLGLGITSACWLALLAVGLSRRRAIIRGFFQVKDVERHIRVKRVGDGALPAVLDDVLMVFPFEDNHEDLAFLYNWLHRTGLLGQDESVTLFQVGGQALSTRSGSSLPDADLLCIPMGALVLNETNAARFAREHAVAGGLLVDCRTKKDGAADAWLANKGAHIPQTMNRWW